MQTENSRIPHGYIYKITNKLNGKCYIGQTVDITRRFNQYKKFQCKHQPKLYNALKKYNIDSFTFELFDTAVDSETLDFLEETYIACFDSVDRGYNCIPGGHVTNSMKGKHHTEESKRKISNQKQGTKNHNFGKPRSGEEKLKMSESQKGYKSINFGKCRSEETKRKISESLKGRHCSEETKQKLSECKKGNKNYTFGKHLSEETRKKISKSLKRNNV
jgi:group I intron endonuclease